MKKQKDSLIPAGMMNDKIIITRDGHVGTLFRTLSDLTSITIELSGDIDRLETFIIAIEKIIDGKHTPYDEVNQLREIIDDAKKQSTSIKSRHSKLLSFLSDMKEKLQLQVVSEGDSNG